MHACGDISIKEILYHNIMMLTNKYIAIINIMIVFHITRFDYTVEQAFIASEISHEINQ